MMRAERFTALPGAPMSTRRPRKSSIRSMPEATGTATCTAMENIRQPHAAGRAEKVAARHRGVREVCGLRIFECQVDRAGLHGVHLRLEVVLLHPVP